MQEEELLSQKDKYINKNSKTEGFILGALSRGYIYTAEYHFTCLPFTFDTYFYFDIKI